MKKITFMVALAWMVMAACVEEEHSNSPPKQQESVGLLNPDEYWPRMVQIGFDTATLIIENCEYWVITTHNANNPHYSGITHKGTCANHQRNEQQYSY